MTAIPIQSRRIVSVDVFRGLTILLMVFVNDLGPAAPAWLLHIQPSDADGMTVADVVFPFFLFIAGMSIPAAIDAGRRRGQSTLAISRHILLRTGGLLLMGLIGVNRSAHTRFDDQLWAMLAYLAILFAWCQVPREPGRRRRVLLTMRTGGWLALIALLACYRRDPVETSLLFYGPVQHWPWLMTQWWGILGLIGWGYGVAATICLLTDARPEWQAIAAGLLMLPFVAQTQGGFTAQFANKPWLDELNPLIQLGRQFFDGVNSLVDIATQLGTLPAIVVLGSLCGSQLRQDSSPTAVGGRIRWMLTYAGWLLLAALLTDVFGGINKIAATPAWCFACSGLAVLCWLVLHAICDLRGRQPGPNLLRITGENPLIAYLLHPIILFALHLTDLGTSVRAYAASPSAAVAITGSACMALAVCLITALVSRTGFRIRI